MLQREQRLILFGRTYWFIEEKENTWFGDQLNPDRQALSLLDSQARIARRSYQAVLDIAHLQQI